MVPVSASAPSFRCRPRRHPRRRACSWAGLADGHTSPPVDAWQGRRSVGDGCPAPRSWNAQRPWRETCGASPNPSVGKRLRPVGNAAQWERRAPSRHTRHGRKTAAQLWLQRRRQMRRVARGRIGVRRAVQPGTTAVPSASRLPPEVSSRSAVGCRSRGAEGSASQRHVRTGCLLARTRETLRWGTGRITDVTRPACGSCCRPAHDQRSERPMRSNLAPGRPGFLRACLTRSTLRAEDSTLAPSQQDSLLDRRTVHLGHTGIMPPALSLVWKRWQSRTTGSVSPRPGHSARSPAGVQA